MRLNLNSILELPERYRRNLINSIHGAKSAFLVGTKSSAGISNVSVFSQVIHIGANPPLVGLLFRPDSVERHTLINIRETKVFTIQNIKQNFFKKAHQTSARYPSDVSEFQECNLTEQEIDNFHAPFVNESSIKLGLVLESEIPIQLNGTHLVVGKIEFIEIEDSAIEKDGFVDPEKTGSIVSVGLDAYFSLNKLARLSYAKPGQILNEVRGE